MGLNNEKGLNISIWNYDSEPSKRIDIAGFYSVRLQMV